MLTVFLCGPGSAQDVASKLPYRFDPANVVDAIARVRSGDFTELNVQMIARARAVQAIPLLETQFLLKQDPFLKGAIASALVSMGDKNDTYWNYLVDVATPAIEDTAPSIMSYDTRGKALAATPSPEFRAWVEARHLSLESATANALYLYPVAVGQLASTGDPRAIPLLRKALLSPNYIVEGIAAEGLAELHDTASIPLIVAACRKAPAEVAESMATHSLLQFGDPTAADEATNFIPEERLDRYRRDGMLPAATSPK
jgi:hypothetical protein